MCVPPQKKRIGVFWKRLVAVPSSDGGDWNWIIKVRTGKVYDVWKGWRRESFLWEAAELLYYTHIYCPVFPFSAAKPWGAGEISVWVN